MSHITTWGTSDAINGLQSLQQFSLQHSYGCMHYTQTYPWQPSHSVNSPHSLHMPLSHLSHVTNYGAHNMQYPLSQLQKIPRRHLHLHVHNKSASCNCSKSNFVTHENHLLRCPHTILIFVHITQNYITRGTAESTIFRDATESS